MELVGGGGKDWGIKEVNYPQKASSHPLQGSQNEEEPGSERALAL